jgi:Zn-dependent M28 family amino/carboxypeptidase
MKVESNTRHLILRTAAALYFLAGSYSYAATITGASGQVSQDQYKTYQQTVQDMGLGLYGGPAYNQGYRGRDGWSGGGSPGNEEASLYLSNSFTAMGLDVTVQGSYKNVVAELPGKKTPQKVYVIGAHYDTYGDDERPGGDDNASGTAGVLEAARVLSQYSFASTIRFIGFNAEEDWTEGSQDYVDNIVVASNETIAGMINLDMILRPGWDNDPLQPRDADMLTGNNALCFAWANIFLEAANIYAPSLEMDPRCPNTDYWYASDQGPFVNAGFPAFGLFENTASEVWGGSNAYYHRPQDASDGLANDPLNPSGVTYDYLFATDIVRASVATLAQEAQLVPEPASAMIMALGAVIIGLRRRK